MSVRDVVGTILWVVLWLVGIGSIIALLLGCEVLQERDKREGAFRVNADCDKNTVSVEFELDQHADDAKKRLNR